MKNIVKEAIKREKEIYAKKLAEEKEAMEKVMEKVMEEAR